MIETIELKPIGVIHSPFTQQKGTPVQPSLSGSAQGWVEVFPEFEEGLQNLEGFERVWLIYWFHRIDSVVLKAIPYLDLQEHGIFATRAPCRPNRIGLSCVRLTGRTGGRIEVADLDVLEGTPLLDIKPYVPGFDVFPVARVGWLDKPLPDKFEADSRFDPKDR
jgi:tRNA (adenine37-N6)-methyltransferase